MIHNSNRDARLVRDRRMLAVTTVIFVLLFVGALVTWLLGV